MSLLDNHIKREIENLKNIDPVFSIPDRNYYKGSINYKLKATNGFNNLQRLVFAYSQCKYNYDLGIFEPTRTLDEIKCSVKYDMKKSLMEIVRDHYQVTQKDSVYSWLEKTQIEDDLYTVWRYSSSIPTSNRSYEHSINIKCILKYLKVRGL